MTWGPCAPTLFKEAILHLTVANETREQALRDLGRELTKLPAKDLALLVGDRLFAYGLAEAAGLTVEAWGRAVWSSELTEARAVALVRGAAQHVAEQHAKAEAEKQKRRRRPGR